MSSSVHVFLTFLFIFPFPASAALPGGCAAAISENEAGLIVLSNNPGLYPIGHAEARAYIDRGVKARLDREAIRWRPMQLTEEFDHEDLIALNCDRSTQLGTLACGLKVKGLTLTIRPEYLARGHRGTAQKVVARKEGSLRIVSLSAADFFTSARPLRSVEFVHELRHNQLESLRELGEMSPYFGELIATEGTLGDLQEAYAYTDYLSLTEFKTFHGELKQRLAKLRSAYLRDPGRIAAELAGVRETFELFFYLGNRTALQLRTIVTQVNDGTVRPVRDGNGALAYATFASGNLVLRLSVGIEDPSVRLNASTRMVFLTGRQLESISPMVGRLGADSDGRAAAALIDQMQTILNPRGVLK